MGKINLPQFETEIRVGEGLQAGERTIIPVIRISILRTDSGDISGAWMTVFAIVIIEPKLVYALSIAGEMMSIEKILEAAPSLKTVVERIDR